MPAYTSEQNEFSALSRLRKNSIPEPHPDLPDPCWIWIRTRTNEGYPNMNYAGKSQSGHRVSYRLHKGEIPEGLFVCHRCDRRACVNPDHLFLSDHPGNMADMVQKGRAWRKARGGGHAPTLTPETIRIIRSTCWPPSDTSSGTRSVRSLARELGVHASTVVRCRDRDTFRDLE